MTPATYTAEQFFGLLGVSTWAGYESVRRGDCPIEPIRVGRRLVWAKAKVDGVLGIESLGESAANPGAVNPTQSEGPAATAGPVATSSSTPASATDRSLHEGSRRA